MSASHNSESMANQGEFHSRVPGSEPLTRKGHAVGVKVGNDAAPEFHAETHPAGTAPEERSFRPQTEGEVPGQAFNDQTETFTGAESTLGGATSQSVHTGLGKPIAGQTSSELHGGKRTKESAGLEGVGASTGVDTVRQKGADLPEGKYRGVKNDDYIGAEERLPASADEVAAERD